MIGYNYFMLTGTIGKIETNVDETRNSVITLKVGRQFREQDGTFKEDEIRVIVFDYLSDIVNDNCQEGQIINVKGRILPSINGNNLIAERIWFIGN